MMRRSTVCHRVYVFLISESKFQLKRLTVRRTCANPMLGSENLDLVYRRVSYFLSLICITYSIFLCNQRSWYCAVYKTSPWIGNVREILYLLRRLLGNGSCSGSMIMQISKQENSTSCFSWNSRRYLHKSHRKSKQKITMKFILH